MLNHWKILALIFLGLAALLFAISFFVPGTYEICSPNQYTHAKECGQYQLAPFVLLRGMGLVDAHNGLVTALATVFVAGFTLTLWLTSKEQGRLTLAQIALARDEFNATHRPRLRVRHVDFQGDRSVLTPLSVNVMLANVGDEVANVISIQFVFAMKIGERWFNGVVPQLSVPIQPDLDVRFVEVGSTIGIPVQVAPQNEIDGTFVAEVLMKRRRLFFIGFIRYKDKRDLIRNTSLCWEYDIPREDFRKPPPDDAELNYED